jgi:hypothetical protein
MSGASASAARCDAASVSAGGRYLIRGRVILLACGAFGLLTGLYGGLWRLGWALPHGGGLAGLHGPLMICGLFGTLISLERAVAIGRGWSYGAPALSAAGSLALIAGLPPTVGMSCLVLGAAILVVASCLVVLRQPALFAWTLLCGALALLVGDILWAAGAAVPDVVGWWLTFLIVTIAGERVELGRVLAPKRGSEALVLFAVGLLVAGAWNGLADNNGATLFGVGLFACAAWLVRHDIAFRTVRQTGQTRFFAVCMIMGVVWLGVAGIVLIAIPPSGSAFGYDLSLHAISIGFVFSMVFGHALIIFPAVTGLRVLYFPAMYGPLGLLHAAVLLRAAGGLLEDHALRLWSGPLTIVALVVFAVCMTIGARAARHESAAAMPDNAASGQAVVIAAGSDSAGT